MDTNTTLIEGTITKVTEARRAPSGSLFLKVDVKTYSVRQGRGGEPYQSVQRHRLAFWDEAAEAAEGRLADGMRIRAKGGLTYDKYTDERGQTRHYTEIRVQQFRCGDVEFDPTHAAVAPN